MRRPWPFGSLFRNEWAEICPPLWLRHIVSWRFLGWLSSRYHICWAGMVSWKMGSESDWSLSKGCFHPYDYCGYYDQCSAEERAAGIRCWTDQPEIYLSLKETP